MKIKELKEFRKLSAKLADKIIRTGDPNIELNKNQKRLIELSKKYRKMVTEYCCGG